MGILDNKKDTIIKLIDFVSTNSGNLKDNEKIKEITDLMKNVVLIIEFAVFKDCAKELAGNEAKLLKEAIEKNLNNELTDEAKGMAGLSNGKNDAVICSGMVGDCLNLVTYGIKEFLAVPGKGKSNTDVFKTSLMGIANNINKILLSKNIKVKISTDIDLD